MTVSAGLPLIPAMEWTIAGLPLHPLVVHAAVVFTPLAALAALAYVFLGRYRDLLRWPTMVLAVVAVVSIWAAYLTGQNFFASAHFQNFSGAILEQIQKHQSYARTLRWIATGFGAGRCTVSGTLPTAAVYGVEHALPELTGGRGFLVCEPAGYAPVS